MFFSLFLPFQKGTAGVEKRGSLDIRIHPEQPDLVPPAELLLTNPAGAQTGKDPEAGRMFQGIPGSSYEAESIDDDESGAPGPETRILFVPNPSEGIYRLTVYGVRTGRYRLEIQAEREDLKPSREVLAEIEITRGTQHQYSIEYSKGKQPRLSVVPVAAAPKN